MQLTFTIPGAPRTKKNSQRLGVGPKKIRPSAAYEKWFDAAMSQAPPIVVAANRITRLPYALPVAVEAHFYLDVQSGQWGDLNGYQQALGDWLQAAKCDRHGRRLRNGAGIIDDDQLIRSWDGSRIHTDLSAPRIEVILRSFES